FGFSFTDSAFIPVQALPSINFLVIEREGLKVSFLSQTTEADSIWWDFGDGNGSSALNPTHRYPIDGMYVVTLTGRNACGQLSYSDTIFFTTHINDAVPFQASLSPNPSKTASQLTITGPISFPYELELVDQLGRKVWTESGLTVRTHLIPRRHLPAGVYWLKIKSTQGTHVLKSWWN
ncbi:MAG: PKD domain-containing protein, partial [Bacteroidota bacterium]